ncbi:DnaB-like helicase N-terminal domain-containing protein [Hydrogenimonas sp.]
MVDENRMMNLNVERAVLSTAIFEPDRFDEMSERLNGDHFAHPFHQRMWGAMEDLHRKGMPIDELFVKQSIDPKAFDEVAFLDVIGANPVSGVDAYVGDLVEKWRRREVAKLAAKMREMAENSDSIDDVIDMATMSMAHLGDEDGEKHCMTFDEAKAYYEKLGKPPLYRTGVSFIDSTLNGGFQLGQLFFLSGAKESGKTFILTKVLENVSQGHKVGFFSLEFGSRMYVENMTGKHGSKYSNPNIYINDWAFDVAEVEREIRYQHKKNGVKFWGIDSQLRLTNKQMAGSTREMWLGDIFSRLARLAMTLDILIMIIVQVSKEGYKSDEPTVKGCVDADHEALTWLHLTKLKGDGERRSALWVKNKQTFKHPKHILEFNPYNHTFKEVKEEKVKTKDGKEVPIEYEE